MISNVSSKVIGTTGFESLQFLRKIASGYIILQLTALLFYLVCYLFFFRSNGIAIFCGLLAIFISLVPACYLLLVKKAPLVFSCLVFFNISPIWFLYLEAVLPGYDAYTSTMPVYRIESFFWVSVFLFLFNLFYLMLWNYLNKLSISVFSFLGSFELSVKFFRNLTAFSFALPLILFYFYYGSFESLWTALVAGRSGGGSAGGLIIQESTGTFSSLMLPVNWLWQLTPFFGTIAFISTRDKRSLNALFPIFLGFLVIFNFFLSGSRGTLIFVAGPVLFFLFYYNWNKGIKFWVVAISILFGLIGIMELQVRYRGNLLDVIANPVKAAKSKGYSSATTFDPTQSHRDNNMYLLCLLVRGYPDKYHFEGFNDLFAILLNPIPRAVWKNKPILKGAQELNMQSNFVLDGPLFIGTTSLTFSVVGEAYQAKGFVGLLLYAFIYSCIITFFDGVVYYAVKRKALAVGFLGINVFLSFWGFRSFFAFISFLYPLILLFVMFKLIVGKSSIN